MTPEGINAAYLKRRVRDLGGCCRKCTWAAWSGAPDWFIFFPFPACHAWIELKAPGKKPGPLQVKEHHEMRRAGCIVFVCDSPEQIDTALSDLFEMSECD